MATNNIHSPNGGTSSDATVSTPSCAYEHLWKDWELVEALRGGTESMRNKREKYLPKEPRESEVAYENRLTRTFLFGLYGRTLYAVTGLAFIKNVVVSGVPDELKYLEFNVDGTGRSLTEFAYDLTIDAVHYGVTHAMADFPSVDSSNMTHAEFLQAGFKPYFTHINPRNMIGWRTTDGPGIPTLGQCRVTESKTVASDENEWSDKEVHYVRVFYPGYTDIYEYDPENGEGYEKVQTITNSLTYIPLVTAYGNKKGYMEGSPAMMSLAQTNLRHYQSSSDQNNILHVARVPFIFASGFEEGELENAEIGPNRMIVSSNPDAKIGHVEHTGQAIGAGRQDLQDLESQMASLGADMILSKGVSRMTATARRLDQSESMSTLQLALRSVEQGIERLYEIAAEWIGVDASEISVSIGEDLSTANEPNPTAAFKLLQEMGILSEEQLLDAGKRLGVLSSYTVLSEDRPSASQAFNEQASERVEVQYDVNEEDDNDD